MAEQETLTQVLQVELCSAEKAPVHKEAVEVIVPGSAGVLTIQPGHTALLTTLMEGVVIIVDRKENEEYFSVTGGFCEVLGEKVLLLAPVFEHGDDVDEARAKQSLERNEERLRKKVEDLDRDRAEASIRRAIARISARNREGL